ncbi:MFS transporter [Bradyrhizobium manausense]|uniref:MFS transporter n=1 Tax=Bradyrhizobium manausense TaxID=989370 RepID=UPI001BA8DCA7|nr:MFS transporter [Bradyrhizobium manausense]MBR0836906.1 MFS transporter [Bradyrhizobium manausense]
MDIQTPAISLGGVDVSNVIDTRRLSRFQIGLFVLCSLVIMIDGFDVQSIAYVAPVLTEAFHIERATLGPVFSAGLVGTVLGALLIAPLAERIGRKIALIGCIALFGVCSLLTTLAADLQQLMIVRLVGGLGLGGATPIAVALGAEFSPQRSRATIVMLIYCGYAIGAAGGGLISAYLLQILTWHAVFVLGAVLPLLLLIAVWLWLPESITYLAYRGTRNDLIAAYARRIDSTVEIDPTGVLQVEDKAIGFPVTQLFAGGRTPRTLWLWLMFVTNILSLYFMISWFPTLATTAGVDVSSALVAASLIQVGSIVGTLTLAALARRFDTFVVMSIGYMGGTVALLLIAMAGSSVAYLMVVAFIAGFFVIGTQTGANAVSSLVYPPSIRATGVGWALGIGRLGAIAGPYVGGVLIALHWTSRDLFMAATVPTAIAAISAMIISKLVRRTGGHL